MKSLFIFLFLILNTQEESRTECNLLIQEAIEAMHQSEHSKSLEILTKVQKISQEKGWYKELFLTINNIGANYYKLSDYGEALENYLLAYDIAISHLNSNEEMIVLNNIGILFYQENKLEEAQKYFSKAYKLADQKTDRFKTGLYAINLGLALNKIGMIEEAREYLLKAQSLLQNNPNVLLQGRYALAENYYLSHEYNIAKDELIRLIPKLNSLEFLEQKTSGLLLLSKMSLSEGNLKDAEEFAVLAQSGFNSLDTQISIYQQLSSLNYRRKNYQTANEYKDSVIFLKDSLYYLKSSSQFEANRVKFAIRNYEIEMIEKTKNYEAERKMLFISFSIIVFIILIIVWIWRNANIRDKQKKIIAERNQKIKMLELESDLEAKNRKLTVKALNMSNRNEVLQEIIQNIKEQVDLSDKPEVKKYVSILNKQIKKDKDQDDFLIHFEETNNGFLSSLREKHPNLNINDVRFLSYLYMNLSIKEISSLLNITPDACRKRKERIAKKIGLQETAELFPYLSHI
ncbi:tetratricopeptide repeat protein [Aequorivita sp. SDUM287046]|uniref:Tetratricopeptide repeat protein n=1 Tax=Aequorivita aurantiaca TaxID=3053356 RepID=A0ABT8DIA5_9FLAO|nr:tetratricopeptide repeat protein [Aequorivita aurantiaca]MDN3725132.1 tetratricopeptide repeat protein [Aequorivita aurantiaca]